MITIDDGKKLSEPSPVLERPYHLSYPFVFFYEGSYYIIPETSSNKTVELYRANNFPDNWEFVMNLFEGKEMIDATIHFTNGKWWLFANSLNHPFVSTNDQLFLFLARNFFRQNGRHILKTLVPLTLTIAVPPEEYSNTITNCSDQHRTMPRNNTAMD